ncbi:MAG: L,D-transpeptidase family protein, partial [Bdellovibrionia bacterium]
MNRIYALIFLMLVSPGARAEPLALEQEFADALPAYVFGVQVRLIGGAIVELAPLKSFFESRSFASIFVGANNQPTPVAAAFKEAVSKAGVRGLNPEDYWSKDMDSRWSPSSREQAIELELLLAQSFLRFSSDLAGGRVDPASIDNEIDFRRRPVTDYNVLNGIVSTAENVKVGLDSLEPKHPSYERLKQNLARYLDLRANGGWKALVAQKKLQLGMSSQAVPALRERLGITGQLSAVDAADPIPLFDDTLRTAVVTYQRQHGLTADGIVGPQFYTSLNIPVEKRIQMVAATMEKWRWLPQNLGERYIFVNLARQELQVVENLQPIIKMKVVVGRVLRRTPSLADQVVDVALNPYWNVPQNLVLKDVLPGVKADPNYFASLGMKVFTPDGATEIDPATIDWKNVSPTTVNYRFRQEPGVHNSLGIVKFNLTNSRAIYMHDTPHKELFPEPTRYFSSGCVRLEKPLELAEYLLKDTGLWEMKKIKEFTKLPVNPDYRIPLARPIPVYLVHL